MQIQVTKPKAKRVALFVCNECNHKFYSVKTAEHAAFYGCPGCNGLDIDIA